MPTADAYWHAAAEFGALADTLAAEAAPVRDALGDDVVAGGRLRLALDDAIAVVTSGVGATADAYAALAAECRRRALACEAYTAALRAHERAVAAYAAASPEQRAQLTMVPAPARAPWMAAG